MAVCAEPGCPEITNGTDSRCPRHYLPSRSGRPMPRDWKRTRQRILTRDQHRCHYCGARATTVDHKIPASAGGPEHDTNLVACCWPCQQHKSNKLV